MKRRCEFVKMLVLGMCLSLAGSVSASNPQTTETTDQTWPGTVSDWRGFSKYSFELGGREAYVVVPKVAAPGNPWVWRARFPDFHAEADLILLERGFHIARIDTDGMLGSPRAMEHWNTFYQFVIEHGLAKKCCLEGVSRGGLFVYGFASRWPERVACIYCDTPVCDIRSWPGGKGTGRGDAATWKTCLEEYGLTEDSAKIFAENPIDRLEQIASARIPILHIISMNDVIVPPPENTLVLTERYRKLGGRIDLIEVAEGTPESNGHHFMHPDPLRVADFIELHASVVPDAGDYFVMRGTLDNCRIKFTRNKTGRVVFLGGSITNMSGWREATCEYLQQKFPETKFEFINAGIPSMGSTPGAFRMLRDVFSSGSVDLLFEEAAVNDLHNMPNETERRRGMEGIVRHARMLDPTLDIVVMHFADVPHIADYGALKTPAVIASHEAVAKHYSVPTIDLAHEAAARIQAGQFDWAADFKDCHPSAFGHRLYASSIRRLLNAAWQSPLNEQSVIIEHPEPEPLDRFSYDGGKLVSIEAASIQQGFAVFSNCDPRAGNVGGGVRDGFVNVPMLVGRKAGDELSFEFEGRGVGMFVAAGPDAGMINYSIDDGEWNELDVFTKWSGGLHIPWAYVLTSELKSGKHVLHLKIAETKNERSQGNVLRIVNFLVNE